ncbi:enoyl-CoA hydratase/carnithine racemase [Trinickia symbiotica]|uniref:Enoyl-CoA hydratase/isomerase family protein n=1 Tax=Trinickia symbiotica TaxID=863227 RepID=A0A2N7X988_9BURK|nr:enoyl-CoA hydratase/isomerase family protein [Trinickia symbiotica]PMS38035.1 enoyl-CoA hydratase/isomerase family protein [Trinickia symbiotica]PPK47308.1 enoyl-CoA hydratase/carnithine racemase [Trinickia symbiotica]
MQQESDVIFAIEGAVATITLNRTARHNALTTRMLDDIDRYVATVERNDEVRVLKFTSNSQRFFCSGADINEWGDIDPQRMGTRFIRDGNRVFRRIAELDKPTIAVLSGSALGGGFELALACDFRYASVDARIGFPEAAVGAIPGWMGCARLSELVGATRTRELILLGEPVGAAIAAQWGIVNEALAADQLAARVDAVCATLQKRSTTSLSVGKRLIRMMESGQHEYAHELAASVCKASPDAAEGVAAFREKRHANFG